MQFDLFIFVHMQSMLYFDMINVLLQYTVNVKTVHGIRKRHQDTGSMADNHAVGGQKKMTVRQDRALIHLSLSDRRLTSTQLQQNVRLDSAGLQRDDGSATYS